jgi:flavin reductase
MSFTATTVSVVTTDGPAGRHGVTVSALSSVSADSERPTILVCVHELSRACEAIRRNGVFCVNVLRDNQAAISDAFAGRRKDIAADKFSVAKWTVEATGSPRIVDPLVALDCELKQEVRQGTHHIFIGAGIIPRDPPRSRQIFA